MPTVKTQATEMKSAKVDRISLVTKAASRIPFKVIKSEEPAMPNPLKTVDLASVGSIFKSQKKDPIPQVVAIATMKGDSLSAVQSAIEAAGFSVKKSAEQEDGSVLLEQVEGADLKEGIVVIKAGEHTALVVKGFSPYNMSMESGDSGASFADLCKAQGFYPGMRTTLDVLSNSVYEVACKSDDPSGAAEAVSKMFDEAKAYAVGLVKALPSKAFKLEAIEIESAVTEEGEEVVNKGEKTGGVHGDHTNEIPGDKKKVDNNLPTSAHQQSGTEPPAANENTGAGDGRHAAKKGEGEGGEEKPGAGEAAAAVQKADTPDFSKLLAEGLAGVTEQLTAKVTDLITPVQKSVEGLNKSVEGLSTKVGEVEGVAKAAKAAVEGTVVGHDAGGDANTSVQKSGDNGYGKGREIDTAFAPRRRAAR